MKNRNTASAACGAYVRQRAGGGGNNGFADGFFRQADETPVIRLMNSGELEILARKLPQDELAAHFSEDAGMAETVIARLFPGMEGEAEKAAEQFGDAFRTVFAAMIYGHEGGMTANTDSLRLLLRGLVLQLFELYDSRKTNRDTELK